MGRPKLPAHGTVRRYRLELRDGKVCDRCRAANTKAKATERANRRARDNRNEMHLVADPQADPTDESMPSSDEAKTTRIPPGVRVDIGSGIENAVRNYFNSVDTNDLLARVYGEIVITVARVISTAEPKDIPKLTEEMVDAAKLMRPASDTGGGSDDPFANLGVAT